MRHARKKSPLAPVAGIEGTKATRINTLATNEPRQITAAPLREALREFPPELFAIRAKAIMTAKTPLELHNAIARYAFAEMWARHSTGRGFDLAREVVINSIRNYVSFSPVRLRTRKRFIAHVVARMDEAARCAVEADA